MINVIKQEIDIEQSLRKRLKIICDFCNVKPTFINSSIRKIEKTNINYIEPNIKDTTFLAFNHSKDIYIQQNLQSKVKISKLQEFIKNL